METIFVDLNSVSLSDDVWIHAMRPGTYHHPVYGKLEFDSERLNRFAQSVNDKVRGIDLDIDYDHKKQDGKAAGWIKNAQVKADGLHLQVELTDPAKEAIQRKEYRYFSPEFTFEWTNPETKIKHRDVIAGGGLTNRPFLKNLNPLKLHEEWKMDLEKLIREKFSLAEDADVSKFLNELDPKSLDGKKLSEIATIKDADDGTKTITVQGAEGELKVEPVKLEEKKGDDEQLKQLAETNPAIKKMLEDREADSKRLHDLEVANTLSEVTMKLSEVDDSSDKRSLAPSVREKTRDLLVKLDEDKRSEVYNILTEIVKGGIVELGEKGRSTTTPNDDGKSVTARLDEKVAEKRKADDKLSYADAVSMIFSEHPELAEEYDREVM